MNPEDNSRKDNRAATKVLRNRLAENLQKETLQRAKSRTKVTILDPVNGGISPKTCKLSSHHSLLTRAETTAEKKTALDPESPARILLQQTSKKLTCFNIKLSFVQRINVNKATGPKGANLHLRTCAVEEALPPTLLFKCLSRTSWPSIWKSARSVSVRKKDSESKPNYY